MGQSVFKAHVSAGILAGFPQLTCLDAASFFADDPKVAPGLVSLTTNTDGVTAETWRAFAESHTQLTSLALTATNPFAIDDAEGVSSLRVFRFDSQLDLAAEGRALRAFISSVLSHNRSLYRLACSVSLNAACIHGALVVWLCV